MREYEFEILWGREEEGTNRRYKERMERKFGKKRGKRFLEKIGFFLEIGNSWHFKLNLTLLILLNIFLLETY